MAHFAKLTEDNRVLSVVVVDDKKCLDSNGSENEEKGRLFLEQIFNWPFWKKTSYNTKNNVHLNNGTPFRGNFAGPNMIYMPEHDIFMSDKPYPSWVLNVAEARWQSPIGDHPVITEEEAKKFVRYDWDETNQIWNKISY